MIKLTRLNSQEIVVNVDLIKFIENTPDTLLTLSTGDNLPIRESIDEVIGRVIEYKRQTHVAPMSSERALEF